MQVESIPYDKVATDFNRIATLSAAIRRGDAILFCRLLRICRAS